MRLKQLLKNKYNQIGLVFLITIIVRIGYSYLAHFIMDKFGAPTGVMNTLGQLCYALPAAIYLVFHSEDVKSILHLRKIRIPSVLLLFVIGVLLVPVMAFVNGISLLFTSNQIASTVGDIITDNSYIYVISVMALIPALLEEFMCRGVFFGALRPAGLWISALTSGLFFGLLHLNLNQFCYALMLGVVMALIVEVTGSLFATMIIHFTINASTTTLSYLMSLMGTNISESANVTTTMPKTSLLLAIGMYGVISVFALAGVIALLYVVCITEGRTQIFQELNPFSKVKRIKTKTENVFSIPLIVGILVCIVLIILSI